MKEEFIQKLQNATTEVFRVNLYQCKDGEETEERVLAIPYFLYIHKGKGSYNIDNVDYKTSPGELYFCPKGSPNTIKANKSDPFLLSGFEFDIDLDPDEINMAFNRRSFISNNEMAVKLIFEMVYYNDKLLKMPYYTNSLFKTFLTLLLYGDENMQTSDVDQNIIEYIYKNKTKSVTLEDLSRKFKYHPNHINRKIIALTGMSVHQLIIEYRMNLAKESLTYTTKSVEIISQLCGYDNANYFSKLFKLKVGKTPSDFRHGGK